MSSARRSAADNRALRISAERSTNANSFKVHDGFARSVCFRQAARRFLVCFFADLDRSAGERLAVAAAPEWPPLRDGE
jgi:hypothetical protein